MRLLRRVLLGALLLPVVVAWSAFAGANTVPASKAGDSTQAITVIDLRPVECASMTLTNIESGSTTVHGTNANDLIFGGSGNDNIDGKNGADCLVGGAGNDSISGNNDNDIILGGPGNDTIRGGGGYDICYGGPGTDTFAQCEEAYQN